MSKRIGLISKTWSHFLKHNASRMGAAVSYYAVFSIAPLSVLLIRIAGFFLGSAAIESTMTGYVQSLFGASTGSFISQLIQNAQHAALGTVGTVVSIASLLVAAVGVLSELDTDMDELWCTEPKTRKAKKQTTAGQILSYLKRKVIALSVIPLIGLLILASTVISQIVGVLGVHLGAYMPALEAIVSYCLQAVLFALLFKILPNTKLPKRELILGGFVTATLFLLGSVLIGAYVNTLATPASFGGAGALVVFLVWIYYSAQVFFLGASFTFVYSKDRGFLAHKAD